MCYGARWNAGLSMSPCGPVFSMIVRLADLTRISARVFECGQVTDERRWATPQSRRNCWVNAALNSGRPSDANSFAMPHVTKHSRNRANPSISQR